MNTTNAWELEYSRKRYLWGGRGPRLPSCPKGSHALDIGCGDGRTLRAALDSGWYIAGMDTSLSAIRSAMQRTGRREGVAFLQGDAEFLPFQDGVFDVVLAVHVFAHITPRGRKKASGEVIRVMKPGGAFLFQDYGTGDMRMEGGTPAGEMTRIKADGIVTHFFTCDEVRDLFPGLRVMKIDSDWRNIRIRGKEYIREEIKALFKKDE